MTARRRRRVGVVVLALVCLASMAPIATARTSRPGPARSVVVGGVDPALRHLAARDPRERVLVIVQFAPRASVKHALQLVRARGGRDESVLPLIHGVAARLTAHSAVELARSTLVHAVSLNARVHSETVDFNPANMATWFNQDAQTENLWGRFTGVGIGVAVIDTGVDGNLPDFQVSQSNTTSRVIASVVVNSSATTAADTYGHGTMVAGLIAGDGGDLPSGDPLFGQYAGSAPDANIIAIKASDDQGNATVLNVLYGIQFAIDYKNAFNIRVINLSLQSDTAESYAIDPLDAAVEAAWSDGIVVVAAAGNNGLGSGVDYSPGNDPYVVTVGAVGDQQTMQHMAQTVHAQNPQQAQALQQAAGLPAPWSSSGSTEDGYNKPDIYGPGRFIPAPLAPDSVFAAACPACIVGGRYIMASGTSLATPIVSGAVADLLQAHPSWTPAMVKGALMHSSTAPPGYPGGSAGLINANTAASVAPNNLVADQGLTPSSLVVTSGAVSSNWAKSSWSTATGPLSAPWATASLTCACSGGEDGAVDPTKSSWSALTWAVDFADVESVF